MNKLLKDPINLVVAGVGGQGNVMVSLVIGNALVHDGYFVTIGETYGSSQRGGSVMSHLKISAEKQFSPLIPEGQADVVLGMEPVETLRVLKSYGNQNVVTVVNPRPIHPVDFTGSGSGYPDMDSLMAQLKAMSAKMYVVNATDEALKMGNAMLANMILIGALLKNGLIPLSEDALVPVIKDMFPKAVTANTKALKAGIDLVSILK
ncbi:MAG: indolepyruvate oxidoreductase subunit beta [Dehalococcoidia bacterium]|nr:indolepyruvate oxidoreductase subunit beta [Dehalococcoidia bacterium]